MTGKATGRDKATAKPSRAGRLLGFLSKPGLIRAGRGAGSPKGQEHPDAGLRRPSNRHAAGITVPRRRCECRNFLHLAGTPPAGAPQAKI